MVYDRRIELTALGLPPTMAFKFKLVAKVRPR